MGFEANTVVGWFGLDRGIMYRICAEERQTKKPPAPDPISAQAGRPSAPLAGIGATWAVEYQGAGQRYKQGRYRGRA